MQNAEYCRIALHGRGGIVVAYALVDADDFERFGRERWRLTSNGYARRQGPRPERRSIFLHREILGLEPGCGLQVDHINRDRLDNRRSNLRAITQAQNNQNVPARRGSTSRYRGVSWSRQAQKWMACVRLNGRSIHLGYFENEDDAAAAAEQGRRVYLPFSAP